MKRTAFRRRHPRGYLLLEALAGSLVLGISMVVIYHRLQLADEQVLETVRRGQAQNLLASEVARFRSLNSAALTACGVSACDDGSWVSAANTVPGTVQKRVNLDPDTTACSVTQPCARITVEVRYKNIVGMWQHLRTSSLIFPF